MTLSPSEINPLSQLMRRLWPIYCFLAALVTFGYALYDPYQIDGDAVSYMDISDLIRAHNWHGVINGYWNPLYPAMLSLGHNLFHPTRYTELHAYYMVNFGIFLLEMLAVVAFTDALIQLRSAQCAFATAPLKASFLFDLYALRYLGIGTLVISTQRELSMGKVRPDALLQALLLLSLAALLKYLATHQLRYASSMGIVLGLAYLTKSFAFLFAFLCILALMTFGIIWQRQTLSRTVAAALLALVCFSIVAAPYIGALSKQRGRFDFGDSGNLNYAWYVGGTEKMHLQKDQTSLFGSAEVHLKHPEDQLLKSPPIFSYKLLPYGTFPDWFDASFWNDQIKAHINPRMQVVAIKYCSARLIRYLFNHPEAWILLTILVLAGARLRLGWRTSDNAFWLVPLLLGVAIVSIYGIVNIEERYISIALLAILTPLFANLRPSNFTETVTLRTASSVAILLLAGLAIGESARTVLELRRNLPFEQLPVGWYNNEIFGAAHALNELGVGQGDEIACVGTIACMYDPYWARLAGVRVLTEIYVPDGPLYPFLTTLSNRDQVYSTVRKQGSKVLVGYFTTDLMTGASPVPDGWRELGTTPFYILPLNLTLQPSTETPQP